MTRYQEADYDFGTLRIPKMLFDLGRLDILDKLTDYELDYDQYTEIVMVATDCVFEVVDNVYDNNSGTHTTTYRDRAMEEFYRLARRYSSKMKIPLKRNPYLLVAKAVVNKYLNIDSSSSGYELHTEAKDCCIVFYFDCFFGEQEELLEGLIQILNHYRQQSAVLQKELGLNPTPSLAPPVHKVE